MPTYERANARLSFPVNLRARFFVAQQFYDPYEIVSVEIWKHAESEAAGGVLVDVIDGTNVIQDSPGHYRLIWDAYNGTSSPASPNPIGTVQGPGSPLQDINDPARIESNVMYFDRWTYVTEQGEQPQKTVGLKFWLYPDLYFVDSGFDRFRFEIKPDRVMLVKGEILDLRLQVIPIPLYVANRDPITNYLIPLTQFQYRWQDTQNNTIYDYQDAVFTGREGIIPTQQIASQLIGAYNLQARLTLPNGQVIQYRKIPIQLVD